MTQEEKQLLLIDLCGRLPYGVKCRIDYDNEEDAFLGIERYADDKIVSVCVETEEIGLYNASEYFYPDEIKPYLRPMSSMTEEEKSECLDIKKGECNGCVLTGKGDPNTEFRLIDFYNKHHLDYRGLIPMGLALEAPEGMYNKKDSEKGSEIPVPKTVDEAVKTLAKIVSKEDRDYLLENGAISMHHSLGRWIRNEWGLWTGSELKNKLKKKGFEHPDDMSNYIIEEYIKYWNNKV